MKRQLIVTIGLCLLLVTAGCTEFQSFEETSTPSEPTTPTPASDLAGLNESGVTDAEAAYSAHKTGLMDTGTWTAEFESYRTDNNQSVTFTEDRLVDHSKQSQLQTIETRGRSVAVYTTPNETYQRLSVNNESSYRYNANGYNSSAATHQTLLISFLSNVEYNLVNTTIENKTTLYTYESVGFTEDSEFNPTGESQVRLENFTANFTVTDEGIIRSFQMETEFVSENRPTLYSGVTVTFSDIGATTVTEPDWTAEAKDRLELNETTTETNESR